MPPAERRRFGVAPLVESTVNLPAPKRAEESSPFKESATGVSSEFCYTAEMSVQIKKETAENTSTAAPAANDLANKKRTQRVIGTELLVVAFAMPPLLAICLEWLGQKFGPEGPIIALCTLVLVGLALSIAGALLLKRVWWTPLLSGILFAAELAATSLWWFLHNLRM